MIIRILFITFVWSEQVLSEKIRSDWDMTVVAMDVCMLYRLVNTLKKANIYLYVMYIICYVCVINAYYIKCI